MSDITAIVRDLDSGSARLPASDVRADPMMEAVAAVIDQKITIGLTAATASIGVALLALIPDTGHAVATTSMWAAIAVPGVLAKWEGLRTRLRGMEREMREVRETVRQMGQDVSVWRTLKAAVLDNDVCPTVYASWFDSWKSTFTYLGLSTLAIIGITAGVAAGVAFPTVESDETTNLLWTLAAFTIFCRTLFSIEKRFSSKSEHGCSASDGLSLGVFLIGIPLAMATHFTGLAEGDRKADLYSVIGRYSARHAVADSINLANAVRDIDSATGDWMLRTLPVLLKDNVDGRITSAKWEAAWNARTDMNPVGGTERLHELLRLGNEAEQMARMGQPQVWRIRD